MQESQPEFLGSAKIAVSRLKATFPEREAEILARYLLEWVTGLGWASILVRPKAVLTAAQAALLSQGVDRLLAGEPVQYILGFQWFHGHRFQVGPAVLIPRPETEELVEWVRQEAPLPSPALLDVGTGSGCIAVTLSLYIRSAQVTAVDVSAAALEVARQNSQDLGGQVQFREMDVLEAQPGDFSALDIIVSNPPYVPMPELDEMQVQVKDHEPHTALFAPGADPLVFYRRILELGRHWLRPGGKVFFEIHRDAGAQVMALAESLGYVEGELRKDMQGNDRMVRWVNPG